MKETSRHYVVTRVLVIAAVVAVLPMSVGFLLIQHSAKTRLTDAAGLNFVSFAEQAGSAVNAAFLRELEFLSSLGRSPAVRTALVSHDMDEAKRFLAETEQASALHRRLAVVDRDLELVADSESSQSLDLPEGLTASKSWASVGADPGTLILARPISDRDSGGSLGLVVAELDAERMFMSVTDFRSGESGRACLFDRRSGRLLAGRRAECGAGDLYARLEDVARARSQGIRYFLADVEGPGSFDRADALLVGYATPELVRSMPELDWVVAVEQPLEEAHAPLEPMFRDLVLYFLLMSGLVLALAAYMTFKLERPVTDVELDLHENLSGKPASGLTASAR
ncbi:MAG TPA: cache domain-containing protein [Vicinamibacteria bacterium]|nr:cache domain-containing protein [Vicinamibacteria bacterium]